MRNHLTAGLLLVLLAGCSADRGTSADKTAAASQALQKNTTALSLAMRKPPSSFASLPDRGELLAYDKARSVKHSGAYTAYPVELSEAHALDAMRTGQMVIKAPNGELIRLKYERHIEHADGNWTWIGRNADGADALITFGDKAVFGTIPQGATNTLRLTMSADHAFLVSTDRSKLAGLDGAPRRSGSDALIPPKLAAATAARKTASMQAQSADVQPAAAAAQIVDVLLGYTQGFVNSFSATGGESAAVTRLVNMVDITNQAYANSGVTMRVRLVGTLKVPNYPDATDNGDALEKLTGYSSSSNSSIPVDPAFTALRAKRDELGADLVSLVRAFRTPENNGCGIAWLIGGNKSGIEASDAPFGYSVVSDGTDKNESDNKTYYCRDETLAHEFGHNMGQAHNTEDSNQPGVHDYSYGYRQSTNGGFYTVMAYPKKDANQYAIRYFANPSVNYKDQFGVDHGPTGIANQSDNVRSMNQTMPIVATFRAQVVATFVDVPTGYWAYSSIQKIYDQGITSGCNASPPLYCPGNTVHRDEMAVFLLRAKHGSSYQPPAATGVYADVPKSYWAAAWIEQLSAEGITGGCATNPLQYCPKSAILRDQMAVLLLRAKHGSSYQPPAATGMFSDVPKTYWAAAWIEQLAREGVTGGCATSPLRYCPTAVVKRDQMAVFLVRNFGL